MALGMLAGKAGRAAAGVFAAAATLVKLAEERRLPPALHLKAEEPKPEFARREATATPQPHLDPHRMTFAPVKWEDNWDRRHHAEPRPKATRHLILVRHGQYNLAGETDEERRLTALGRAQAEATGARLAQLRVPVTRIFQSDMVRAKETAELIAARVEDRERKGPFPVERPDPILREGAPVRPEPDVGHWHPGADYFSDGTRIEAAFRKYFHRAEPGQERDSYEVVVCHANVIRYFFCRALQFPPEAWLRISLKHASLTWVEIRPDGRVAVTALGDAGHFKADMLTTS